MDQLKLQVLAITGKRHDSPEGRKLLHELTVSKTFSGFAEWSGIERSRNPEQSAEWALDRLERYIASGRIKPSPTQHALDIPSGGPLPGEENDEGNDENIPL